LKGFTGILFPGSQEDHDLDLNNSILLPPWAGVLGLVQVDVKTDAVARELDNLDDEDLLPCELDVDTDLVIQLMEHINTTASLDDVAT
jgi:hypothetical protein